MNKVKPKKSKESTTSFHHSSSGNCSFTAREALRGATTTLHNTKPKGKVVVGMSGGVDSSVAAALLCEQGYEVTGVFMHYWHEPVSKAGDFNSKSFENKCCSVSSLKQARDVAAILGMSLVTINLEKEFKQEIVDYFLKEYGEARTPNPCVLCNKKIKFAHLLAQADKVGAEFVATGHYARVSREGKSKKEKVKRYRLLKGVDEVKDQSYFLWQLGQKELSRTLLPIGDYKKAEVRELARKFKLPVAEKPESFEVCFVPQDDYRGFLERNLKNKPKKGEIADNLGKVLGEHEGLPFYTVGQRKGINVNAKTPRWEPFYVLGQNAKTNTLVVGKDEDLYQTEVNLKNVSFLSGEIPQKPIECAVKIRYGMKPAKATLICKRSQLSVVSCQLSFEEPQRAITPGQSAVFYATSPPPKADRPLGERLRGTSPGDEVLGGGVIVG